MALKRFPVDTLKIGRSFLTGVGGEPADYAMVEAIAALARRLGLRVVAMGAERPEQLDVLRRIEGVWVQGYALGPPMPADELTTYLARRWPDRAGDLLPGAVTAGPAAGREQTG